jgi:hypothetical protein
MAVWKWCLSITLDYQREWQPDHLRTPGVLGKLATAVGLPIHQLAITGELEVIRIFPRLSQRESLHVLTLLLHPARSIALQLCLSDGHQWVVGKNMAGNWWRLSLALTPLAAASALPLPPRKATTPQNNKHDFTWFYLSKNLSGVTKNQKKLHIYTHINVVNTISKTIPKSSPFLFVVCLPSPSLVDLFLVFPR